MKRLFVLALLLVGLVTTGCASKAPGGPAPSSTASASSQVQQDTLGQLASVAGYEIAGAPQYEKTRCTITVRVPGCGADVVLAGNEAAEPVSPTSFVVQSVAGVPFAALSTADANNLTAETLKSLSQAILGCT